MNRRVILVGGTGAFGERLARLLSQWPQIELVIAARGLPRAEALARELGCQAAGFDRDHPETLQTLAPWAVIDAAGPFQQGDLRLAQRAITLGAHYIDIADGRRFVAAFAEALDAPAKAAGVLAVTGASSTPALSNAALDAMTRDWAAIDVAKVAISPGARAPRGLSVVRAILSYVGRPVAVFSGGGWRWEAGWSGLVRMDFPGLGRRLVSLCETPDLDIMARRVRREARFLAGLELAPLHVGLWLLAWLPRALLVRSLEPLAEPLRAIADYMAPWGTDRGGMVVEAQGEGADGLARVARWSLAAEENAGPTVPVAAAAAVLRGLLAERITQRGAQPCVGLVTLDQIMAELAGLPVMTRLDGGLGEPTLLRTVLGEDVERLPEPVAAVHDKVAARTFMGRGRAGGSRHWFVRVLRALVGLPEPGAYPRISVTIAPEPGGETWLRDFGPRRFRSHLRKVSAPRQFEERFGPVRFRFSPHLRDDGFDWRLASWSLLGMTLPKSWAPQIRATSYARDGVYRFRALTAHKWLGVVFAYRGRLDV